MPHSAARFLLVCLASIASGVAVAPAEAPDESDAPDFRHAWSSAQWSELSSAQRQGLLDRLAAGGDQTVRFLRERLLVKVDAGQVAGLIGRLDHRDFRAREQATRQLVKMGRGVQPIVQRHLARAGNAEVRARLQAVLDELDSYRPAPEQWARMDVAVATLVRIGSEPARKLLADLAEQWSGPKQAMALAKLRDLHRMHIRLRGDWAAAAAIRGTPGNAENLTAGEHLAAARLLAAHPALAGDPEARLLLARALRLGKLAERIARQRAQSDLAPADRVALARDCLVYLGMPDVALEILPEGADAGLQAVATIANRPGESSSAQLVRVAEYLAAIQSDPDQMLARQRLLRAGIWFHRAAEKAGKDRAELLQRARRQEVAAERLAGKLTGWRNLLVGLRPRGQIRAGNWKLDETGSWRVEQGDFALAEIPAEIRGDYLLHVELTRTTGRDGIYIGFPVGKESLNLNLSGWEGQATGLETIGGRQAISGPAKVRPGKLSNDVRHTLQIEVSLDEKQATITVRLDGKEILKHTGDRKDMAAAKHVWDRKDLSAVAIGAHRCQVLFHSIRIRTPGPDQAEKPGAAALENQ